MGVARVRNSGVQPDWGWVPAFAGMTIEYRSRDDRYRLTADETHTPALDSNCHSREGGNPGRQTEQRGRRERGHTLTSRRCEPESAAEKVSGAQPGTGNRCIATPKGSLV